MTQEEFDRLFDEAYLTTYEPRQDPHEAEVEALAAARLTGCEAGAEILDCPCGYGRHAIALAQAGYKVVGADRSAALLEQARTLGEGIEVVFVQADYRELPFEDDRFDAVLNLFPSIGYTGREGDTEALREFRRVLRPGGRLVVETMQRDRLAGIFQPRMWERLPEGLLLEERTFDLVDGVMHATITYLPDEGEARAYPHSLRVYTATELAEMTREAGFEQAEFYGGYEQEEL